MTDEELQRWISLFYQTGVRLGLTYAADAPRSVAELDADDRAIVECMVHTARAFAKQEGMVHVN